MVRLLAMSEGDREFDLAERLEEDLGQVQHDRVIKAAEDLRRRAAAALDELYDPHKRMRFTQHRFATNDGGSQASTFITGTGDSGGSTLQPLAPSTTMSVLGATDDAEPAGALSPLKARVTRGMALQRKRDIQRAQLNDTNKGHQTEVIKCGADMLFPVN